MNVFQTPSNVLKVATGKKHHGKDSDRKVKGLRGKVDMSSKPVRA